MTTITALITPMQGQTPDDVLAAALGTQHERALIENATARRAKAGDLVQVTIRYATGAGEAEYADCADRLSRTPSMGVDSIQVR